MLAGVTKNKLKYFDIYYTEMFHLSSDDSKNASVFQIENGAEKISIPLSISDYSVPEYFVEGIEYLIMI